MIKGLLMMIFLLTSNFEDKQFVQDEHAAIERATNAWGQAIGKRDAEKIVALYAENFMLYATFKNSISTREKLVAYFENLTKKEGLNVDFDEENVRVYGPVAINSGLYTFSFLENGERKKVPARYTFVYTLTPGGWKIVDHHSSILPQ